jgi:FMN phosphatase YigB (HAD superfamily)/DNA-binding XRE family transcriptional regulator
MTDGVDEKSLGLRLQAARKAAGLTQQELCQKAKLAYSTLAKIERGAIKSPSIFTIQSIADSLGLSLDQLIGSNAAGPPKAAKKTAKNGVRFVYFDVNGCLVRFYHQAFTRLAHETNMPIELIETTFLHYNDAVCRGEMTLKDFNQVFAGRLGLPALDWQSYYLDAVEPIKQMSELVGWAAEHYQIGLLTNIMPGFIKALQAAHKLPTLPYQAVIDSSVVRAIKPEAKIFQIAQEKAGVQGHEILLVDDDRTNLMAAEKLGWHVLWFDDYRPAEMVENIRRSLAF